MTPLHSWKTAEAIEHMNIVKREEKQQEQQKDVEDQAIF
jgi:hypothetical protein